MSLIGLLRTFVRHRSGLGSYLLFFWTWLCPCLYRLHPIQFLLKEGESPWPLLRKQVTCSVLEEPWFSELVPDANSNPPPCNFRASNFARLMFWDVNGLSCCVVLPRCPYFHCSLHVLIIAGPVKLSLRWVSTFCSNPVDGTFAACMNLWTNGE